MINTNNCEGPCLPWCFKYNENKYLFTGFVCGVLVGVILFIIYHMYVNRHIKKNKNNQRNSHITNS